MNQKLTSEEESKKISSISSQSTQGQGRQQIPVGFPGSSEYSILIRQPQQINTQSPQDLSNVQPRQVYPQQPIQGPSLQPQTTHTTQQPLLNLPNNLTDQETARIRNSGQILHSSQVSLQYSELIRLFGGINNPLAQNLPLNSLPPKPIVHPHLPNGRNVGGFPSDKTNDTVEEKYDDDDLIVDKPVTDQKMQEENPSTNISDQIRLTLKLKNKLLQINSASAQTYPMIASLSVDDLKTNTRASVDLVCVLDVSGSMAGEKLRLLIQTLEYLLTLLSDDDRLCIITFNDASRRLSRLLRMTQTGKKDIQMIIKRIGAGGGTNIAAGMKHALQVIKDRRTRNQVTGVFLLSDGIDYHSGTESRVRNLLTASALEENFTISCFGYGNDHSPDEMTKIAELKDGSFFYIEKYSQLEGCFVDCLGGLISVVAEDVKLQIQVEPSEIFPEMKILKCYGQNLWTEDIKNKAYTIKLEQLISGKQKDFVLLVQIPPTTRSLLDHEKATTIASAKCEMKLTVNDSKDLLVKKAELSVTFSNEEEEFKADEPYKDVMINYYRVRAAEIIFETRELADQRKYKEAKKMLADFREELKASQFKQETIVAKLIEQLETVLKGIEPEHYQNYGRHQMFQSRSVLQNQQSHPTYNMYSNSMQIQMQCAQINRK